ncbi:hypothetical protein MHB77_23620 [Paenibacillus sp. FSL K6-3166]|uniref:hypothetical protein n=1 Tax=unclassified Paenibacillus TaxID=185978 RepID=UPI000BA08174|nr:hypothetical protein [Paenibacillus sp. VTT E-133291]OZQ91470.1 hypothetical protein CA598_12080 [Paenibacillus sp. VTT E-133291]
MDYAPKQMIEMSVALLIFLMAATSGFILFHTGSSLNSLTYLSGRDQDRSLHQTYSPLAGDGTLSGSEVLHTLARLEEGDAEIIVDGVRYAPSFPRESLQAANVNLQARYVPIYERDTDGRLQRVLVRSLP